PAAEGAHEKGKDSKADAESKGSDAKAALAEARTVRQKSGCGAAVKAYDDVGARFPATVVAAEAMWEAADCYKSMGDTARARELYQALRSYASYRDRAEAELGDANANMAGNQMASKAAAGPPPAAAAAAPKMAAKKPAAEAPQASPQATAAGGGNPPVKPAAPAPARQTGPGAADAYGY
ncbi:MAG: tetratricopeptide repeat protein, partial [Polyangiaceae bacterium]|nr:tetratricopeptide repeat protein [Polyangiaceae bacterium]